MKKESAGEMPVQVTKATIGAIYEDVRAIDFKCGYYGIDPRKIKLLSQDKQRVTIERRKSKTGDYTIIMDIQDRFPIRDRDRVRGDDSTYHTERIILYRNDNNPPFCLLSIGTSKDGEFTFVKTVPLSEAMGQKFHKVLSELENGNMIRQQETLKEKVDSAQRSKNIRRLFEEKFHLAAKHNGLLKKDNTIRADYERDNIHFFLSTNSDPHVLSYTCVTVTPSEPNIVLLAENGQDDRRHLQLQYLIPPAGVDDQRILYRLLSHPIMGDNKIIIDSRGDSLDADYFEFADAEEVGILEGFLLRLESIHLKRIN